MDYEEDENRPLGDFGSLLGIPAATDAEELALNEELDLSGPGTSTQAWLVKVCRPSLVSCSQCNQE